MKFLSGLLKTLSILILIIATMACTAVCVAAAVMEAYIVMGLVWVGCLFVALNIWGTAISLSEIVKLRKKVAELEQRNTYYPGVQRPMTAAPQTIPADPQQTQPIPPIPQLQPVMAPQAPSKTGMKKWLPAIIGGGAGLLVLIVLIVVITAGGIGGKPAIVPEDSEPAQVEATPIPDIEPETIAPEEVNIEEWQVMLDTSEVRPEDIPEDVKKILVEAGVLSGDEGEAPSASPSAETVTLGTTFGTDFVEFTFTDFIVEKDIKHSVKTGVVTRITGPDPVDGQQYVLLEGTIVNTSKAPLPVYDFYAGRYVIDGYTYDLNSTNCDILDAEGQTVSEIDPLMEYKVRIYVAIPDKLAESFESCEFAFGFYDGFDNYDLSYNRSFGDDAVAACPYQYNLIAKD